MKDLLKKLQAVLNTPAGVMAALAAITLAGGFLALFLIESIDTAILKDVVLKNRLFEFIAPIAFAAIVSIALYLLIFKPMGGRQAELERQLDELSFFQKVAVRRELRMEEWSEAIDELRNQLSPEKTGNSQLTAGSPEKPRHASGQSATQLMEKRQRSALLFMLEELSGERNKIEQAHQEWMAALDAVNDLIFIHDRQFRIMRCNKAYQQCAGVPFQEIIGQPYYEVFPKSGAPLVSCLREMAKAGGGEKEEVAVGNAIYYSNAFSIHDEQGAYIFSVHTLEDITERKQAEQNQARLAAILEATPDFIGIADAKDNHILYINKAGRKMSGLSEDEDVTRLTMDDFIPERSIKIFYDEMVPSTIRDGKWEGDFTILNLSNVREYPVSMVLLSHKAPGGEIETFSTISRDITDRKISENKLRLSSQLLDNSADSIMAFDLDGNFIYLNEAAWKTRGYTSDELMAMNLHELDVPAYEKFVETRIGELMVKGSITFEAAHRCKDGSIMPIEASSRIIESDGRKIIISVARDITERKQAEANFAKQLEELRRWHDTTLGRERRILELKHEINELLDLAAQPPRYPSAESQNQTEE